MTFVYTDSTAVVGPLATMRDPHAWDLCVGHASRITAPRGWELVRHAGPLAATHPDEDDLVALADAVREGHDGVSSPSPANGFSPHTDGAPSGGHNGTAHAGAPAGGVLTSPARRSGGTGRRRGHLRVLPDPQD